MNFWDTVICFIIPFTFIIIGFIMWKHGPKKINYFIGWRTNKSMKNQDTWDFANTYGGKLFFILGVVEFIATMFIVFFSKIMLTPNIVLWAVCIQTALILLIIIRVESELKKRFF